MGEKELNSPFKDFRYICSKFTMGVTRLKRKEAKIRMRAEQRVKTIKLLKQIVTVKSPYKGESGIIIEDSQS